MTEHGWPAIFVVAAWWLSTGCVLWLVGLPSRATRWTLLGATAMLGGALLASAHAAAATTVPAAYLGFAGGLGVWAWQEIAFLTGAVTGLRRTGSMPGTWRHAWHATLAIAHHEIAIAAGAAALLAICWGTPNPVALWTYLALWAMRVSAKLNVFLGVRNLNENFLPGALAHLAPYLRRRTMNPLLPLSITVGTALATVVLAEAAVSAPAQAVALTLVGTLLALAVLEHWFMVLPVPAEKLFEWGLRSRGPDLLAPVAVPRRATKGFGGER